MTQRERHTSGEAPPRDATHPLAAPPDSLSTAGASAWVEWFHRASPAQQQDALRRAEAQGILYAHELAVPAHAAPPRSLLPALLNGQIKDLEPLHPPTLDFQDRELDAIQRDAAARAVATPDVCLIQGFPGTGKSRVIAEILVQAAQRGQRILFLASSTAALDCVLERLGSHSTVCPIRCLAAEENVSELPPALSRLTLPERVRSYRETTLPAARAAREAARRTLEARQNQVPPWEDLEELARRLEEGAARLHELNERRARLATEAEHLDPAAGPLGERWETCTRGRAEALEHLDGQLASLRAERETILGKQGHLDNEWEQVQPLAEARQGGRIWTAAWWSSWLRGGLAEQVRELETRRAELLAAQQRLERDIAGCQAERTAIEERHAVECRRLREEDFARRQGELDADSAAVSREQETLRGQWQQLSHAAPAEMSRAAVAAARAEWERQREQDERQAASAEEWLHAVEQGLPHLPDKLARCANVVAATTAALPADAHFGDRNGKPPMLFDLLILEEAHQVTESEFAAAARRARRWVLVGEPLTEDEPATPSRRLGRVAVPRPGFFQRLWHTLHADPHRSPFAWFQRDGRLVCRLRPIPPEKEACIETEAVVDQPDIELRILTVPRQSPQIAEVIFPAGMGIAAAKQFIYRELGELALGTRGQRMHWTETDEDVSLHFAADAGIASEAVVLEEGICEWVRSVLPAHAAHSPEQNFWDTFRVQFARAAGWTRERAEQWIAERLGLRSLGRTALLTVPHRLAPPLACFVSDLLFGGACEAPRATNEAETSSAVEFVAVPSLAVVESRPRAAAEKPWSGEERHDSGPQGRAAVSVRAPRLRSVKGGAGLELDLADERAREQLPEELRSILPRSGFVNYLEAQALVKRLEALLGDGAFRAACAQWQQRREQWCEHRCAAPSAECGCPRPASAPAVAVMALYPAQVELLRHLIRQAETLAQPLIPIEIGLPSAFHQRECLIGLVSLTRSHAHRAVSYGDQPHSLAQALTRAASGLLLFGDPGTLARRSQWHGALDHLDDAAARREGGLAGRLVQYLQGHGPHPSAFRMQEGSGV